jgi:hypothetical protein
MNKKYYPLFPHIIKNLVLIRDIDKQLKEMPMENEVIQKAGYYTSKLLNTLRHLTNSKPSTGALEVTEVDFFDERINRFWDAVSKNYDFIVSRGQNYLNWRYLDPRTGDYKVRMILEDNQIIGYSVLRINAYRKEYPVGYIVDLLTVPNRLDAIHTLTKDAIRFFDGKDVNLVNYQVVKGHPNEKVMEGYGFLDSRINISMFIVMDDNSELMDTIKNTTPDRVYFSYGDLDTLPVGIVESV